MSRWRRLSARAYHGLTVRNEADAARNFEFYEETGAPKVEAGKETMDTKTKDTNTKDRKSRLAFDAAELKMLYVSIGCHAEMLRGQAVILDQKQSEYAPNVKAAMALQERIAALLAGGKDPA